MSGVRVPPPLPTQTYETHSGPLRAVEIPRKRGLFGSNLRSSLRTTVACFVLSKAVFSGPAELGRLARRLARIEIITVLRPASCVLLNAVLVGGGISDRDRVFRFMGPRCGRAASPSRSDERSLSLSPTLRNHRGISCLVMGCRKPPSSSDRYRSGNSSHGREQELCGLGQGTAGRPRSASREFAAP